MKNNKTIVIGIILIALGAMSFITGILYTLMLPNIYSSTSMVVVEFSEAGTQQYTAEALIALTKQKAALVKIRDVFDPVIVEQNMTEKWGLKETPIAHDIAFKILLDCVESVADEEAVGLIRIVVFREDPNEASVLANSISSNYQKLHDDSISIVEKATPGIRPVSPNLFLNVMRSLIQAVIIAGIGLLLLFIGKRSEPGT